MRVTLRRPPHSPGEGTAQMFPAALGWAGPAADPFFPRESGGEAGSALALPPCLRLLSLPLQSDGSAPSAQAPSSPPFFTAALAVQSGGREGPRRSLGGFGTSRPTQPGLPHQLVVPSINQWREGRRQIPTSQGNKLNVIYRMLRSHAMLLPPQRHPHPWQEDSNQRMRAARRDCKEGPQQLFSWPSPPGPKREPAVFAADLGASFEAPKNNTPPLHDNFWGPSYAVAGLC